MRALVLGLASVLASAGWSSTAHARVDEKGRPFARGTLQPSLGLGGAFTRDLSVLSIGLGARYFVVNGLGPGLSVSDTILIYGKSLRADFPGIESQIPTNIVHLMPNLQWVFVRTRWFSPYVIGGVGPVFYNHGGGTVGEWMAGAGAFIGIGGPVFIDLGVGFSSVFPRSKCDDAFSYEGPSGRQKVLEACAFTWGPRLGLTVAFGVGGDEGKRRRPREDAPPPPPATRAWEEPAPVEPVPEDLEPAPENPAPENAEPTPTEPTPTEPTPEGPAPPSEAEPTPSPAPRPAAPDTPLPDPPLPDPPG